MLKLVYVIILSLTCSHLYSQCGSATLRTQAQVDEFIQDNPNCSEMSNLTLGYQSFSDPESDINDLSGFVNLTRLTGKLIVGHCENLLSLEGLQNLKYIGNNCLFNQNKNLKEIVGFNNLDSIGNTLSFYLNDSLRIIDGFNNLKYMNGDIRFNYNRKLNTIKGFGSISYVDGSIIMNDCWELDLSESFDNLSSIEDLLTIREVALTDFNMFSSLDSIGGTMIVADCPNLQNMDAFSNLNFSGDLFLDDNTNLIDISGLSNLYTVNAFRLKNSKVKNIIGISSLVLGENGYIWIAENDSLVSLNGLNFNETINGLIRIKDNSQLEDLNAMLGLHTVVNKLEIINNDNLVSLSGLDSLTNVEGNLTITFNNKLNYCREICNLLNLGNIDGSTYIYNNKIGCSNTTEVSNSCTMDLIVNSSESEGVNTLREILTYAISGDTITFDNNLYGTSIILDSTLCVANDVTIIGLGINGTTINGQCDTGMKILSTSNVRLENMELSTNNTEIEFLELNGILSVKNIKISINN